MVWSTCYTPVFLSVSALPCPAQPCLSTLKSQDYYLSLLLICVFLYPLRVCTRPNSKRRSLTFFVFRFFKSLLFSFCQFVPRQGIFHLSCHPSPLQIGEGVGLHRRECRESAGCKPLQSAVYGESRPRLPQITPLSAAHPGSPFAGGSPLPFATYPGPPFAVERCRRPWLTQPDWCECGKPDWC